MDGRRPVFFLYFSPGIVPLSLLVTGAINVESPAINLFTFPFKKTFVPSFLFYYFFRFGIGTK